MGVLKIMVGGSQKVSRGPSLGSSKLSLGGMFNVDFNILNLTSKSRRNIAMLNFNIYFLD